MSSKGKCIDYHVEKADVWDFIGDYMSKDLVAIALNDGKYLIIQSLNCNWCYCTKGILERELQYAQRAHIFGEYAIDMDKYGYRQTIEKSTCYSTVGEEFADIINKKE